MKCFYHITDSNDAYRNLALEELLFQAIKPDEVTLYLWQNENTVVIGRNQNAWRECRLDAFSAQNGKLARRMTGGGAVYHDLGNQNFSFLASPKLYNLKRQTEVIQRAVKNFGIDAYFSGRNDILADGRKFSGNAYHQSAHGALHHGTILISSDMARLGQFLNPSPEKLVAKGVESVRARVMNLSEIAPHITAEAMRKALLEAFQEVYGVEAKPLPLDRLDQSCWDALTERYQSEEWRLGHVSAFSYGLRQRFSFGEIELLFQVEQGLIKQMEIYSDVMDADWILRMKENLQGTEFSAQAVSEAVPESVQCPEIQKELADYLYETLMNA